MKKNKRVFVANIPVRGTLSGYVMIPHDTPHEELHDAIAEALRDSGYERPGVQGPPNDITVDEPALDAADFRTPFFNIDD